MASEQVLMSRLRVLVSHPPVPVASQRVQTGYVLSLWQALTHKNARRTVFLRPGYLLKAR